ncbi:MAG: hypothetical protein U0105_27055 [Candidatus Obscuribacterales bacterium]
MKTRLLIAALVLAATTSIASFSAPAYSASDWQNYQPTFLSEQDLMASYYARELSYMHSQYGLPEGFTAQQYGDAVADKRIREYRKTYNIGPNFTSAELAAAIGAKSVQWNYGHLDLPNNFTAEQLRNAQFLSRLKFETKRHQGLPFPFSYEDYVRVTGAETANALATEYQLPTAWVYADLLRAVGPHRAAKIRQDSGFAKTATHAEIERAMGLDRAAYLIKDRNLPTGFTASQLSAMAPAFNQYSTEAKLPPNFTEADLVAYFGQIKLALIQREFGISGPFTEADLRKAIAAKAIENLAADYDLALNFTEADLAQAYALSSTIDVRLTYHLRPDFSAAEYEAAWKKVRSDFDRVNQPGFYYYGEMRY